MRGVRWKPLFQGFLLVCVLSFSLISCSSETDDQLLAKMSAGMRAGNFCNQPEALRAASKLLSRENPQIKDPKIVDCFITTGALLLTDEAEWKNRSEAQRVYDLVRRYENAIVVEGLVRKVIQDEKNRLHVLFFGVKLGIPRSEERLNQVLVDHGDKKMAEDFLNSGSPALHKGGEQWARKHGHFIRTGMGSHRVSWGKF